MIRKRANDELPKTILPDNVISCPMSAYVVISKEEAGKNKVKLISTAGFLECVGVAACLYSQDGQFEGAGLTHLTVHEDERTTLNALCSELQSIDKNGTIKITLVGGSEYLGKREHPWHSNASLIEGVKSTLSNYQIENHLLDDLADPISVDMRTGEIFLGIAKDNDPIFTLSAASMYQNFLTSNDEVKKHIQGIRRRGLDQDVRLPAISLNWKLIIQDLQTSYQKNKAAIERVLADEYGVSPPSAERR